MGICFIGSRNFEHFIEEVGILTFDNQGFCLIGESYVHYSWKYV